MRRESTVALVIIVIVLMFPSAARPAQYAGRLSAIQGRVGLQQGKLPSRRVSLPISLRVGDVVRIGTGGSAYVFLEASRERYVLAAGSGVRVERRSLSRLSGPLPRKRQPAARLRRIRGGVELFEAHILGVSARSDRKQPAVNVSGLRNPSPLFAIRDAPITLRWEGPHRAAANPDVAGLELRISELAGKKRRVVLRRDLSPDARQFTVPPEIIKPGRWYLWRVAEQVDEPGEGQRTGSVLRILTSEERAELARVEREADARRRTAPASADLLRAEAYEELGLLPRALEFYVSALSLTNDPEVKESVDYLRDALDRARSL